MVKGLLLLMIAGMMGQSVEVEKKLEAKPRVVPITSEQHHHLVVDNEYVRVFHVEVAPHAETLYHQHDMDYVFVTLGDSKVVSERIDGKSVTLELKDGDTRFTKGGFAHKAVNLSDKPFVNVTVELKNLPAERTVVSCNECTRTWKEHGATIKRTWLYQDSSIGVARWDLEGAMKDPPMLQLSGHLLVALNEFLLERGANHPDSKVFQAGELEWQKAGKYIWRPEMSASFVTIEAAQAK